MRRLFAVCLLLLFSPSAFAAPANYRYDQEESNVKFSVRHMGVVTMAGYFTRFSGAFTCDPEDFSTGRVDIDIQTASVETGRNWSAKKLVSEEFFWAEKYPRILFESRSFENVQGRQFDIYGDLTIRGITKQVVFKTAILPSFKDADGKIWTHFKSEALIRRADFKLGTGGFFDPLLRAMDETLAITLDVKGEPA